MKEAEYKRMQAEMTDLIARGRQLSTEERKAFNQGVLACKAILKEYFLYHNLEDIAAQTQRTGAECHIGDAVYEATPLRVFAGVVKKILYETDGVTFDASAIGRTVFFSAEEAREKMRRMRGERKDST